MARNHNKTISLSEAASGKIKDGHKVSPESQSSITSHVYLKSPTAASLDKNVVLRQIRHHKHKSKVKSAFRAFMRSSSSSSTTLTPNRQPAALPHQTPAYTATRSRRSTT
ncbi:hypothetical protein ACFX13_025000 [Malus domestica]